MTERDIELACQRAGAPGPQPSSDIAAAALLRELAAGNAPSEVLRARLVAALGTPSIGQAAAHQDNRVRWSVATPAQRGQALRELLELGDRLPARPHRPLAFPPMGRPTGA